MVADTEAEKKIVTDEKTTFRFHATSLRMAICSSRHESRSKPPSEIQSMDGTGVFAQEQRDFCCVRVNVFNNKQLQLFKYKGRSSGSGSGELKMNSLASSVLFLASLKHLKVFSVPGFCFQLETQTSYNPNIVVRFHHDVDQPNCQSHFAHHWTKTATDYLVQARPEMRQYRRKIVWNEPLRSNEPHLDLMSQISSIKRNFDQGQTLNGACRV